MSAFNLLILPLAFGLIGFVSPCSLGINAVFLSYIQGKPRLVRVRQSLGFMLTRGLFLALLGLLFGLVGQAVTDFQLLYRPVIGALFIALGLVFIAQLYRPLPLPCFSLANRFGGYGTGSAVAMGALFGLDIPACTSPLVFALLAQTVLAGDMLGGFVSLYVFGIGMSLPLVALGVLESPNQWLMAWARKSRKSLYVTGAALLILVGLATFSPRVMGIVGAPLFVLARWLGL
jgi:cytochrome c-type biogenesis protein